MHTICYMILSCEFIQQLIYHHIKIKSHEHSLVTNFFPKSLLSKMQYQPMYKASYLPLGRCRTLLLYPPKKSDNFLLAAICFLIFYFLFLSSADVFSNDFVGLFFCFFRLLFDGNVE